MDILVRSGQELGTILAKILPRSCHGFHFAIVRSYQDRHVSKKILTEKPKMARKISYELLVLEKKQRQKNVKLKTIENLKLTLNYKNTEKSLQPLE